MEPLTIEGTVEHGQIRLEEPIDLPENTKVSVVVAENQGRRTVRVSPRLAHPDQAEHFRLEVIEDAPDAKL
jgi:hypothetical protein